MKAKTDQLRGGVMKAIFGQMRAMLVMFVVTTVELSVGFGIMGLDYAVLLALVIAFLDGSSRGTEYVIRECRKRGVAVEVHLIQTK